MSVISWSDVSVISVCDDRSGESGGGANSISCSCVIVGSVFVLKSLCAFCVKCVWMCELFVIVSVGVASLLMPRSLPLKRKAPTFNPSFTFSLVMLLFCVLRFICVIKVSISCGDGGRGIYGVCIELYF